MCKSLHLHIVFKDYTSLKESAIDNKMNSKNDIRHTGRRSKYVNMRNRILTRHAELLISVNYGLSWKNTGSSPEVSPQNIVIKQYAI